MQKNYSVKMIMGDPVIVSQAPADVRNWGPWQFPAIERLTDGKLHISFHIHEDSAKAYGLDNGHAISDDNGATWKEVFSPVDNGGLLLPNGDRLKSKRMCSLKLSESGIELPSTIGSYGNYSSTNTLYRASDFPEDQKVWTFSRAVKGSNKWIDEQAKVNIPGETRYVTQGLLPYPCIWRMRLDKEGNLWGLEYTHRICDGALSKMNAVFIRSKDQGHTWDYVSEIPYLYDKQQDIKGDQHEGFTEPDIVFMPDGSIFSLLRTTDGSGIGPLYWSRSTDGGETWSKPCIYDDIGVWPTLITMDSGVTLAVYGRPGLYLRATHDPSGLEWDSRVTVVEPGKLGNNTCSYGDLIALDANTLLLAYSDFNFLNSNGEKCKTILTRKITVLY